MSVNLGENKPKPRGRFTRDVFDAREVYGRREQSVARGSDTFERECKDSSVSFSCPSFRAILIRFAVLSSFLMRHLILTSF